MRFVFKVVLFSNEFGLDSFDCVIYAQNNQSAFNKLLRELGILKRYLCGIYLDPVRSDVSVYESR